MPSLMRFLTVFIFFVSHIFGTLKRYYGTDVSDHINSKLDEKSQKDPFVRYLRLYMAYYWFTLSANAYFAFKYALFYLLYELNYLTKHRYLSCILFGRVTLYSSCDGLPKYFSLYTGVQNLLWQMGMLYYKHRFSFGYNEFLMLDREKVLRLEMLVKSEIDDNDAKVADPIDLSNGRQLISCNTSHDYLLFNQRGLKIPLWEKEEYQHIIRVCCIKLERTNQHYGMITTHYWRPNRSADTHRVLAKQLVRSFVIMYGVTWAVYVSLISLESSKFFTLRGFEIVYKNCINWIPDERRETNIADLYSFIYPQRDFNYSLAKPDPWQLMVPWENFIRFNWYHLLRLISDFVEITVLTTQAVAVLALTHVVCSMIGQDVCIYASNIKLHLIRLIRRRRRLISVYSGCSCITNEENITNQLNTTENNYHIAHCAITNISAFELTTYNQLNEETNRIQGMIEDLLQSIVEYNKFINVATWRYLFVWMTFTLFTSYYLFKLPTDTVATKAETTTETASIPSNTPTWTISNLETYILQIMFASICLPLVHYFAKVRKQSQELYNLIASCTALELETRQNFSKKWLQLMQSYHPKPLNAFTVKGRDISWLSVLQFLAWMFSALFVLTTFRFI